MVDIGPIDDAIVLLLLLNGNYYKPSLCLFRSTEVRLSIVQSLWCIFYGLPVAISSSLRLLSCLHLEDVPLVCPAQLFWTIFQHISETIHRHLTRSDDISKRTIFPRYQLSGDALAF